METNTVAQFQTAQGSSTSAGNDVSNSNSLGIMGMTAMLYMLIEELRKVLGDINEKYNETVMKNIEVQSASGIVNAQMVKESGDQQAKGYWFQMGSAIASVGIAIGATVASSMAFKSLQNRQGDLDAQTNTLEELKTPFANQGAGVHPEAGDLGFTTEDSEHVDDAVINKVQNGLYNSGPEDNAKAIYSMDDDQLAVAKKNYDNEVLVNSQNALKVSQDLNSRRQLIPIVDQGLNGAGGAVSAGGQASTTQKKAEADKTSALAQTASSIAASSVGTSSSKNQAILDEIAQMTQILKAANDSQRMN